LKKNIYVTFLVSTFSLLFSACTTKSLTSSSLFLCSLSPSLTLTAPFLRPPSSTQLLAFTPAQKTLFACILQMLVSSTFPTASISHTTPNGP
jgi:hypothetical protein